jgi:hypothetical protein
MIAWLLLAATSTSGVEARIGAIVDGRDRLPSLVEVQSAAEVALELTGADEAEGWSRRARLRGLVPALDGRFGTDTDLTVRDSEENGGWSTLGHGLGFDVSAKLALGDLVFSDIELRASRERTARSAAIRLAKERVTRLYFRWIEVRIALDDEPTIERLIEAQRIEALLRAATGGRLAIPKKGHR